MKTRSNILIHRSTWLTMTKNHHFPMNRCSFSKKGLMDSTSSERKPLLETNSQQPPASLHAWKMNSGSFPFLGSKLGAFLNRVGSLQPNHQGVLGFRPKFLRKVCLWDFNDAASSEPHLRLRIFTFKRFFHPKKSWTLGKVKVVGGEMVILSDFTFQFFGVI